MIVKEPPSEERFVPIKRLVEVERTFGWLGRWRRLSRCSDAGDREPGAGRGDRALVDISPRSHRTAGGGQLDPVPSDGYTPTRYPCSCVKEEAVAREQGRRINVVLDEEHAAKLNEMAARTYVQPGTIARSLLSTAIDQADTEAATITAILDSIPGAWERTQEGLADIRAGRVVPLDQL
jgi:predicted transcriptional regulator